MIQKKWWLLQTLLLICVRFTIPGMEDDFFVQRSMGVARGVICGTCNTGALEKQNQSLHGDKSRLLLFSATDLCGKNPALWYSRHFSFNCILRLLHGKMQFTFLDLLMQFLFPMAVTACICFGLLCNKYAVNEIVSIALCLLWSAVWWMITWSEEIYTALVTPVWISLFGMAVLFLAVAIYKTLRNCSGC